MSRSRQERPATRLHYTITDIGGPEKLAQYLKEKKVAEEEWQSKAHAGRAEHRANAMSVVSMDKTAAEPTAEERKETRYLDSKRASADERRYKYLPYQAQTPKSFTQKVRSWLSKTFFQ